MANIGDAQHFSNISANTSAFTLAGGKYGVSYSATWGGGSVTLQALGPDGSTYLTAATAFSANGYSTVDLAPGQYRFAVTTATAIYLAVARIPEG
jgi:hypothetical protein